MIATLWHLELSPYNEKARWALDYKGVPHRRRTSLPGLHRATALRVTKGGHDRLPVLGLGGRRVGDSTAIIAALEEAYPDPALYPAGAADRARALELEDYFDEHLGPEARRFAFHYTLGDSDAVIESVMPRAGDGRKRLLRTLLPVARPIVRHDYTINAEAAESARGAILAAMDRIEAELQPSGYLVGDSFGVADLTGAALFTPLLCPPERQYPPDYLAPEVMELREELEARLGGQWVTRMYAQHRGTSAEVAAERAA